MTKFQISNPPVCHSVTGLDSEALTMKMNVIDLLVGNPTTVVAVHNQSQEVKLTLRDRTQKLTCFEGCCNLLNLVPGLSFWL